MSYKDYLSEKIAALEDQIAKSTGEKEVLLKALNDLKMKEFEEELRTEGQQLLKG